MSLNFHLFLDYQENNILYNFIPRSQGKLEQIRELEQKLRYWQKKLKWR